MRQGYCYTCLAIGGGGYFGRVTKNIFSVYFKYPKHLLGQNFPSEVKLGESSLRGKIIPLRDKFPLKIAFSFPWNGQFSQEMKGLGKKDLLRLEGKFLTFPPEGKFTSSHFLASKDVWGSSG